MHIETVLLQLVGVSGFGCEEKISQAVVKWMGCPLTKACFPSNVYAS